MNDTLDAIKKVMEEIDSAWDRGDATSFASYWAEDATVVSPFGEVTEGRSSIEEDMNAQFAGPMKGTTHILKSSKFYKVNSDVVIVDGDVEVASKSMPAWPANFTALFTKEESGKWVLHHMRSYIFIKSDFPQK